MADDDEGPGTGTHARAARGRPRRSRNPPFRRRSDGQQPPDAARTRGRWLRGAASGFGWRGDGVAGYHPDGRGAGPDRRAGSFRLDRVVATCPAPLSVAVVGAAATPGMSVSGPVTSSRAASTVSYTLNRAGALCSMPAVRSLVRTRSLQRRIIAAAGDEVLEFAAEAGQRGAPALLVLPPAPRTRAMRPRRGRSGCWRSCEARACGW